MITRWALAPLIAGRMAGLAGRMAGHHPLNRRAVTGGALRRFLVVRSSAPAGATYRGCWVWFFWLYDRA